MQRQLLWIFFDCDLMLWKWLAITLALKKWDGRSYIRPRSAEREGLEFTEV
jgi:hypothetical protein